jgi:hypothetical protein
MQQGRGLARQEAGVDEVGLFDVQARVAALELAGAIVPDAVEENQRCAMARGRVVGRKRLRAIA